jgi:hypothetical protein
MEESLRSASHGLHVYENKIYAVTGNGRVAEVNPDSFHVERVLDVNNESFTECFETSHPHQHVLSDFSGCLRKGHLSEGVFEMGVKIDNGPSHCVRWDSKFGRYWATADNQGGFFLVDESLQHAALQKMTRDDVEWIVAEPTWNRVWVSCFDHHIYEYENKPVPQLARSIGPFKFQVKQTEYASGKLFVLLESGELLRLDAHTGETEAGLDFQGNCAWDFVADFDHPQRLWCALEDGSVRIVKLIEGDGSSVSISETNLFRYDFGRIRRIVSLGDGRGAACISTSGHVLRISDEGQIVWKLKTKGILRDISLSPQRDKISFVNEAGQFFEAKADTGDILHEQSFDVPLWAVCYLEDGRICVGSRRKKAFIFENDRTSQMEFNTFENIKDITLSSEGHVVINGPGYVAVYDKCTLQILNSYHDGLITTCESVIIDAEDIYTCSYHVLINRFRPGTNETVTTWGDLPDFPKRIRFHSTPAGEKLLLVSGRGPYLSAYRRTEDGIFKLNDFYFPS